VTAAVPVLSSAEAADLCLMLMRADTEEEAIEILKAAGLWDNPDAWRLFSDNDNAFSVIGNQQAEAIAAFVEKIINSVDARLINACRLAGCDPEGPDAPQSMREAVARFFESKEHPTEKDGRISEWPDEQARREGRLLTVAATGNTPSEGQPSLTVADQGEGQTPDDFPNTFMSIQRNNKLRTPFVQGKFNMGGTGALQFSKLQLVVSRRNPALLAVGASERDYQWGFTIVRREWPPGGARNSVFRYLAPVPIGDGTSGILSFSAEEWPIFPEATKDVRDAYHRKSAYGSLVKLYEYTWQGVKSNIVQSGDGLLRRIDVGLPELALPVRVYECRPGYGGEKGHAGSFQTSALGLISRLDRDRESNLETDEPIGGVIALDDGKQIRLRVYVFRDAKKAKAYRNWRHGVVFGLNGQMHAAYTLDFFTRNRVNLSYLKDSLLVFIDCSAIDGQTREDLFMNSRDRLRDSRLSRTLEAKLENFLHNEPTLRELQNRRRQQQIQNKLKDDKPLGDVLEGLMKDNPLLSRLFLHGLNLSAPFPPGSGSGGSNKGTANKFIGKRFPSYFRFKDRKDGEALSRPARLGTKVHVAFETDAEDSYFSRDVEPGAWNVRRKIGGQYVDAGGWNTSGPKSGIAQLWFDSVPDDAKIGDRVEYLIEVTDPSRIESFQVGLILTVQPPAEDGGGGGGGRSKNANSGKGGAGGTGTNLKLPNIITMRREDWTEADDELSALRVVHAGPSADPSALVYDFYVNLDNKYLLHSQKERTTSADLLEKQFIYGLVLVGLALLQDHQRRAKDSKVDGADEAESVENYVTRTARALAPVLLPLIQAIGSLEDK
jgi:hypothetical protein